jgi:hypothetical protein
MGIGEWPRYAQRMDCIDLKALEIGQHAVSKWPNSPPNMGTRPENLRGKSWMKASLQTGKCILVVVRNLDGA